MYFATFVFAGDNSDDSFSLETEEFIGFID